VTGITLLASSRFGINNAIARGLITGVLAGVLIFRKRILALCPARVGGLEPRREAMLTVLIGAALGDHGIGLLGRRRRPRCHRRHAALSEAADGAHRRLRHCPRGAAVLLAGIGHWDAGLDRLAFARRARARLAARHPTRQLRLGPAAESILRGTLPTTLLLVADSSYCSGEPRPACRQLLP
jgi:hypothetical protein